MSTLTNKQDSHAPHSCAVLAMTGQRNFACPDFIKNLLPHCPNVLLPSNAFTMAEILISLTIIGVIAALTLPALQANINEKAWKTQRKALYSRMSQAISMMPSLNGYGTYAGSWSADSVSVTADTAAQAFVTDGLAKVLNISNICTIPANTSSENARRELKKCGLPEKLSTLKNSKIDFPTKLSEFNPQFVSKFVTPNDLIFNIDSNFTKIDTAAAAFELKNGESIAVFYNPYCRGDLQSAIKYDSDSTDQSSTTTRSYGVQAYMCANFIYDLNGSKGPNKFGKDIGYITALYPSDSEVVTSNISNKTVVGKYNEINHLCKNADNESRSANIQEIMSIFYNKRLIDIVDHTNKFYYQSAILASPYRAWTITIHTGLMVDYRKDESHKCQCVKR